jgi:Family of unknown function (DUF6058)
MAVYTDITSAEDGKVSAVATTTTFTEADLDYLRREFRTLEQICAGRAETPDEVRRLIVERRLPQPPYVLDDGTELVPPDYFALSDAGGGLDGIRDEFERRYRAGLERYGVPFDHDLFERRWEGYLDGTPAICMRDVTPETVIRKRLLIDEIERLTAEPRPDDDHWRSSLRNAVDELDAVEKPFAPDYDRARFVPTRDTYVRDVREAYPALWS